MIASAQAPPDIGLTQVEAMTGIVPAQHVAIAFTNNGSAPLSVKLLTGAVRGNQ